MKGGAIDGSRGLGVPGPGEVHGQGGDGGGQLPVVAGQVVQGDGGVEQVQARVWVAVDGFKAGRVGRGYGLKERDPLLAAEGQRLTEGVQRAGRVDVGERPPSPISAYVIHAGLA